MSGSALLCDTLLRCLFQSYGIKLLSLTNCLGNNSGYARVKMTRQLPSMYHVPTEITKASLQWIRK